MGSIWGNIWEIYGKCEITPIIVMKCDEPWICFMGQPFFERTPTMLYPVRIGIGQKAEGFWHQNYGYATAGCTKGPQETHNLIYALRLSNVSIPAWYICEFAYYFANTSCSLLLDVLFWLVPCWFSTTGDGRSTSLFAGHLSLSDPWEVANVVQFFAPKHLAGRHLLTRQYVASPGTCRACLPEATRWCDWGHGHADGCKDGKCQHG